MLFILGRNASFILLSTLSGRNWMYRSLIRENNPRVNFVWCSPKKNWKPFTNCHPLQGTVHEFQPGTNTRYKYPVQIHATTYTNQQFVDYRFIFRLCSLVLPGTQSTPKVNLIYEPKSSLWNVSQSTAPQSLIRWCTCDEVLPEVISFLMWPAPVWDKAF